jgi:L-asparaginase
MTKKILLLSTGGTIASVLSAKGLVPGESGEALLGMIGKLNYDITVKDLLFMD